ncbi:hypothetical protein LCGC14_1573940 [marine sediment metagenome]|uniref:Uncharacterized protein n=1 Tax=marine sediment metagenome TaxID=412755 RepID=A0A0F9IIW3_9ZZZZ
MPTHSIASLEGGAKKIYSILVADYGLGGAFKVSRRVRDLLKEERLRRKALPPSERCLDEDEDTTKGEKKIKGKKAKKKTAGPGLFASLCVLFDKKGVDKVTYAEAKACAKEAKPDSDLSKGHWKWYKKCYKKKG